MLGDGERQVAPELGGIRKDHVERYRWAAERLGIRADRVLDCGCGVGYGASLLAKAGHQVDAFDRSADAIEYARRHYWPGGANFVQRTAEHLDLKDDAYDAAVAFELIEHIEDPLPFLKALAAGCKRLLVSVPNEAVFPFKGYRFHFRHYTRDDLEKALDEAGWRVTSWWGQAGPESAVERDLEGRTLLADCVPTRASNALPAGEKQVSRLGLRAPEIEAPAAKALEHVAILGLGESLAGYVDFVKRVGGRRAFCDEVWVINALGDVIQADRIFHMDDVRVQERRAAAGNEAIGTMLAWLKTHPGPIYTSRPHPDYPGMVAFPLEDAINLCGMPYFNSTAAYAVAFALLQGVKRLSLFGLDFTYPDRAGAEQGRACVEFWLGVAYARGVAIKVAASSSLLDAGTPDTRVYGYDTLDVSVKRQADGSCRVDLTPHERIPTAEEIEERYDHGATAPARQSAA